MSQDPRLPVMLSVAGSDPSGGAGIQGDLKTSTALGVYGAAVLTSLTVQNTRGVHDVHTLPADVVARQCRAVLEDLHVEAVKVGMLGNASIVAAVTTELTRWNDARGGATPAPLVVDPVVVSSSGHALLDDDGVRRLRQLLGMAAVITPNLAEAGMLLGRARATSVEQMREQADALRAQLGCTGVLLTGGHLVGDPVDVWATGQGVRELWGSRVGTPHTHGTGCALSSAIAACYVNCGDWDEAVERAVVWLREALQRGAAAASPGHGPGSAQHVPHSGETSAPLG